MTADRLPRPRTRRGWRRLYQASAIAAILLFLPISIVRLYADDYERTAADVPYRPVAIVFGASAVGGVPSEYLAGRLNVALSLYRHGKVSVLLVTGDNSRPDYDEPTAMMDYLVAHGVPAARIVRDFAGFDTWESCVREREIFGVTSATLVTQDFHLPRALMLCRAAGIDAVGVPDTSYTGTEEALHDRSREVAAGFKALIQAAVQPAPRFLGPKENGVAVALAAAGKHL